MKNYFAKTPLWLQAVFPQRIWRKPTDQKVVYLTFDDGPIPEVTPWVLEQLKTHQALATFFCVGDNVRKHPDIYRKVCTGGHQVGNHSFHHLNGWKTPTEVYLNDVSACAKFVDSNLFRPPYGKLKPAQAKALLPDYDLIMWDVLSGDFDESLSPETCLDHVLNNVRPGSIIVFHDSQKAWHRLWYVLPKVLQKLTEDGYRFERL